MKKTILLLLCSMCVAAGTANAEELVIQLKSGNSITIQYSGSIQGVTWNGATDGIAGLTMPPPPANAAPKAVQQAVPAAAAPTAEEKKSEGSGIRFRWAEPVRED